KSREDSGEASPSRQHEEPLFPRGQCEPPEAPPSQPEEEAEEEPQQQQTCIVKEGSSSAQIEPDLRRSDGQPESAKMHFEEKVATSETNKPKTLSCSHQSCTASSAREATPPAKSGFCRVSVPAEISQETLFRGNAEGGYSEHGEQQEAPDEHEQPTGSARAFHDKLVDQLPLAAGVIFLAPREQREVAEKPEKKGIIAALLEHLYQHRISYSPAAKPQSKDESTTTAKGNGDGTGLEGTQQLNITSSVGEPSLPADSNQERHSFSGELQQEAPPHKKQQHHCLGRLPNETESEVTTEIHRSTALDTGIGRQEIASPSTSPRLPLERPDHQVSIAHSHERSAAGEAAERQRSQGDGNSSFPAIPVAAAPSFFTSFGSAAESSEATGNFQDASEGAELEPEKPDHQVSIAHSREPSAAGEAAERQRSQGDGNSSFPAIPVAAAPSFFTSFGSAAESSEATGNFQDASEGAELEPEKPDHQVSIAHSREPSAAGEAAERQRSQGDGNSSFPAIPVAAAPSFFTSFGSAAESSEATGNFQDASEGAELEPEKPDHQVSIAHSREPPAAGEAAERQRSQGDGNSSFPAIPVAAAPSFFTSFGSSAESSEATGNFQDASEGAELEPEKPDHQVSIAHSREPPAAGEAAERQRSQGDGNSSFPAIPVAAAPSFFTSFGSAAESSEATGNFQDASEGAELEPEKPDHQVSIAHSREPPAAGEAAERQRSQGDGNSSFPAIPVAAAPSFFTSFGSAAESSEATGNFQDASEGAELEPEKPDHQVSIAHSREPSAAGEAAERQRSQGDGNSSFPAIPVAAAPSFFTSFGSSAESSEATGNFQDASEGAELEPEKPDHQVSIAHSREPPAAGEAAERQRSQGDGNSSFPAIPVAAAPSFFTSFGSAAESSEATGNFQDASEGAELEPEKPDHQVSIAHSREPSAAGEAAERQRSQGDGNSSFPAIPVAAAPSFFTSFGSAAESSEATGNFQDASEGAELEPEKPDHQVSIAHSREPSAAGEAAERQRSQGDGNSSFPAIPVAAAPSFFTSFGSAAESSEATGNFQDASEGAELEPEKPDHQVSIAHSREPPAAGEAAERQRSQGDGNSSFPAIPVAAAPSFFTSFGSAAESSEATGNFQDASEGAELEPEKPDHQVSIAHSREPSAAGEAAERQRSQGDGNSSFPAIPVAAAPSFFTSFGSSAESSEATGNFQDASEGAELEPEKPDHQVSIAHSREPPAAGEAAERQRSQGDGNSSFPAIPVAAAPSFFTSFGSAAESSEATGNFQDASEGAELEPEKPDHHVAVEPSAERSAGMPIQQKSNIS
ncbi:Cell surface glycoprotein 1, related, partial [Eimeria tenella]